MNLCQGCWDLSEKKDWREAAVGGTWEGVVEWGWEEGGKGLGGVGISGSGIC